MEDRRSSPPEPTDEALAARVAAHDVGAFTALYDRYAWPVYALAAQTLGSDDSEEVVQDIFVRLWHKADQFDPARGRFVAWFMTVARHRVLDELRRRSQQQQWLAAEAVESLLVEVADPSSDVEEAVWFRERGEAIRQALRSLPAEQRRVLMLSYFGGLSQSAIAEHLGWPLGTVKKRIRLGLQKLRAALTQHDAAVEMSDEPEARDAS